MARLLFLGDFLGDCNKDIHREKADTILVITGQVLEQGYHFLDDDCRVHLLDEFGEIIRRLSQSVPSIYESRSYGLERGVIYQV